MNKKILVTGGAGLNALVIGRHGQVAQTLLATQPEHIQVKAVGRQEIDIHNIDSIIEAIEKNSANIVINTAAYTHVDDAESHPEEVFILNEQAAANIAAASQITHARLIHLSTDYIFSGEKHSPYLVTDAADAVNIYGKSKLAGEQAVLAANPDCCIVRTSWLYSRFGNNFVKTMLKLMQSRDSLSIINDQTACPTSAIALGQFVWLLSQQKKWQQVYHWSDTGRATWYQFALEIQNLAIDLGKITRRIPIIPVSSEQFPTPAKRPKFSLLDISASEQIMTPRPWQQNLRSIIKTL